VTVLASVLVIAAPRPALAQDETHWGVTGSVVPTWIVPKQISPVFGVDRNAPVSVVDVTGSEFRVGIVRGRERGGEWGVSLVHKRFRNSSIIAQEDAAAFADPNGLAIGITTHGFSYSLDDVTLTGVSIERFSPLATIGNVAQIGLTYGGGVAALRGTASGLVFDQAGTTAETHPVDQLFVEGDERVSLFHVGHMSIHAVPLARLELTFSSTIARGVKLRGSGGFNFPGYEAGSISVVYLFGAR
jgi:hypothetical protein